METVLGWHDLSQIRINAHFGRELKRVLQLPMSVPSTAFVAVDYHIDWLYGAVGIAQSGVDPKLFFQSAKENRPRKNPNHYSRAAKQYEREIAGSQEDIDLLIAFADAQGHVHLIFGEAKFDQDWDRKQLHRKCERLKTWSEFAAQNNCDVSSYLVLLSPKKPGKVRSILKSGVAMAGELARGHAELPWIPLKTNRAFLKVERCNGRGAPSKTGKYWHYAKTS
ncbi:MAG TPA: hypothetical protein VF678_10050 [bacterium]